MKAFPEKLGALPGEYKVLISKVEMTEIPPKDSAANHTVKRKDPVCPLRTAIRPSPS